MIVRRHFKLVFRNVVACAAGFGFCRFDQQCRNNENGKLNIFLHGNKIYAIEIAVQFSFAIENGLIIRTNTFIFICWAGTVGTNQIHLILNMEAEGVMFALRFNEFLVMHRPTTL